MINNSELRRSMATLFMLLTPLSCGPDETASDCVSVDEQLGSPASREWCEGEFYPPMQWEGELADKALTVCLPPRADGTCELCPTATVIASVEEKMHEVLDEHRPQCELEHWELGCMRTVENAIMLGREPDYCCFEVALWGEGCADSNG